MFMVVIDITRLVTSDNHECELIVHVNSVVEMIVDYFRICNWSIYTFSVNFSESLSIVLKLGGGLG